MNLIDGVVLVGFYFGDFLFFFCFFFVFLFIFVLGFHLFSCGRVVGMFELALWGVLALFVVVGLCLQ